MDIGKTYNSFQKLERARIFALVSLHHCAIEFIIMFILSVFIALHSSIQHLSF